MSSGQKDQNNNINNAVQIIERFGGDSSYGYENGCCRDDHSRMEAA